MSFFKRLFESEKERTERLIAERKREAVKKGFKDKITMIAKLLGAKINPEDDRCEGDLCGIDEYLFSDAVMQVYSKTVFRDSSIWYIWRINLMNTSNPDCVFEAHGSTEGERFNRIEAYVLGSWEIHFESLYSRSLPVQAERNKKAADAARMEEQNKRKRFGL